MIDLSKSYGGEKVQDHDVRRVGAMIAELRARAIRLWQAALVFLLLAILAATFFIGVLPAPDNSAIQLLPTDHSLEIPKQLGDTITAAFGTADWSRSGFAEPPRLDERWRPFSYAISVALAVFIALWRWGKTSGTLRRRVIQTVSHGSLTMLLTAGFASHILWRVSVEAVMADPKDLGASRMFMEDRARPGATGTGDLGEAEFHKRAGNTYWCDLMLKAKPAIRGFSMRSPNLDRCALSIDLAQLKPPLIADQARYVFAQKAYLEQHDDIAIAYLAGLSGAWTVSDEVTWMRLRIMASTLRIRHPGADLSAVDRFMAQRDQERVAGRAGLVALGVVPTLNARPRKTLGWKTPAEALDECLLEIDKPRVATTS